MKTFLILLSLFPSFFGLLAKSPNIVIVITDDQGYGDLGCTGNPVIKTPHTDKLANESVWLTGGPDVRSLDQSDGCVAHHYGPIYAADQGRDARSVL